jgi:hypothetical protein
MSVPNSIGMRMNEPLAFISVCWGSEINTFEFERRECAFFSFFGFGLAGHWLSLLNVVAMTNR